MSQKEQSSATERVILVVDTAQEDLTVALRRGEAMLAARTEHVGNKHAERVLGLVAEVLEEAGLEKRAIGVVGFGAGPGSFTGLRVACGVAQGLAWALEVPVVALSNLEALAEHTLAEKPLAPGKRVAAVNDARMNECYAAIYEVPAEHAAGERLVCVKAAALLKPEEAEAYLRRERRRTPVRLGPRRLCGCFQGARRHRSRRRVACVRGGLLPLGGKRRCVRAHDGARGGSAPLRARPRGAHDGRACCGRAPLKPLRSFLVRRHAFMTKTFAFMLARPTLASLLGEEAGSFSHFVVRGAEAADIKRLAEREAEVEATPWGEAAFADALRVGRPVLVLEKPVGSRRFCRVGRVHACP